jgi:uncharacterized protein (TIGR00375 family)
MPRWLSECESSLVEVDKSGLHALSTSGGTSQFPLFMITGEVDAEFQVKDQSKRIHLLVLCPNFEIAKQINDRISKYGNLNSDGRPKLKITASEFTEIVTEIDQWNEVIPAHAWTPWFSLFGSRSGFDSIEDCFGDQTRRIHALETGLSSDPAMNWRLSCLDRYTLVSNSDSHSPWPYRLGREANVLELSEVSYREIVEVIREKDVKRFLMTIETDPCYGKYHYSGHRDCNVVLSPKEARSFRYICPVCRRKLTVGVLDRVEELADRPEGYKLEGAIPYVSLIPLQEIISSALGLRDVFGRAVWEEYGKLIKKFSNEFRVLLEASREEILPVSGARIADAILRVREKKAQVAPGYDGVYGHLELFEGETAPMGDTTQLNEKRNGAERREESKESQKEKGSAQRNLSDYF